MNRCQVHKSRSKNNYVVSVVCEFEEQGNPFEEEGEELIATHTKYVMDSAIVDPLLIPLFKKGSLIDPSRLQLRTVGKNANPRKRLKSQG